MFLNKSGFNENRFRVLVGIQILWFIVILILGAWWGHIITQQSKEIYALSLQAGIPEVTALHSKNKVARMIYWELGTFFVFILGSSALMFWLYWKDFKRTQGLAHFFTSLTHEIKTPLTSIKLQAETLQDSLEKQPHPQKLIHRLLEDTGRLENQVIRSLELARLEGGGGVFLQPVDLKSTLLKSIHEFKENHPSFTFPYKIHMEPTLSNALILADIYALETIFRNLFENTYVHNYSHSSEIEISLTENKNKIIFTYEDHGEIKNIDFKNLGTLFLKGMHSKGAGIGLYLIKFLSTQMGGSVDYLPSVLKNGRTALKTVLTFQKTSLESSGANG